MKLSIIIPVYNSEKFLDKCLASIINQTYKNLEIIIINDGSTDNSKKIIDKYISYGYLTKTSAGYKLTNNGILVSNFILADFLQ